MKHTKTIALLSSAAILLGACGNGGSDSASNKKDEGTKDATVAVKDIKTKPEDAIKKAQPTYKNQVLKDISYEKSNGDWVYKVEQQDTKNNKESEVIINDKDKKVIHKETEKGESNQSNDTFKYSDVKNYKDAIKSAQKDFDGDVKEWSLSKDDGKLVYNFDLQKGKEKHEVTVDAKTGKVLDNQKDD